MAIAIAVLLALADQAVAAWIVQGLQLPARAGSHVDLPGPVDLTFVRNTGASFGILNDGTRASRATLTAFGVAAVIGMFWYLRTATRWPSILALTLILAGALGNLADRIVRGYVVDYVDASALGFPWVFNLADTFINVGVGVLILDWLATSRRSTLGLPASGTHH